MQNTIALSYHMGICIGCPKNLGALAPCLLRSRGRARLTWNMRLPRRVYHAEFGRCKSNGMGIRMDQQNLGSLGPASLDWRRGWPQNLPIRCMGLTGQIWLLLVKPYEHTDLPTHPHCAFSISPYKVTQSHRKWRCLAGYLLCGFISYPFPR